jgi:hypothetical protein
VARNVEALTLSSTASAEPWPDASQPTASMQLSGPRMWLNPNRPASDCPIALAAISALELVRSQQENSPFWQNQHCAATRICTRTFELFGKIYVARFTDTLIIRADGCGTNPQYGVNINSFDFSSGAGVRVLNGTN